MKLEILFFFTSMENRKREVFFHNLKVISYTHSFVRFIIFGDSFHTDIRAAFEVFYFNNNVTGYDL